MSKVKIVFDISVPPASWRLSLDAWNDTSDVIRGEIVRHEREHAEMIPINRDRLAGRGKRCKGGWHELHICERDGDEERAAELRERLAPEEARRLENEELFEGEFGQMAKAAGTTLPAVLQRYSQMEGLLRTDPEAGLNALFTHLGLSPREWAKSYLEKCRAIDARIQGLIFEKVQDPAGLRAHMLREGIEFLNEPEVA